MFCGALDENLNTWVYHINELAAYSAHITLLGNSVTFVKMLLQFHNCHAACV